jgi:hypothetical protein
MDHFGGGGSGYTNQHPMVNMALGSQPMALHHGAPSPGARHIPAQNSPMADMYAAQNGLYATGGHGLQSQGSFGHMAPQLHGLQPQSIDGYVLQGNSGRRVSLLRIRLQTYFLEFPGLTMSARSETLD